MEGRASVKPRVRMVGTGWVASAGALIYVSVPREDRFCLPHTRFLLHQPAGGAGDRTVGARRAGRGRRGVLQELPGTGFP